MLTPGSWRSELCENALKSEKVENFWILVDVQGATYMRAPSNWHSNAPTGHLSMWFEDILPCQGHSQLSWKLSSYLKQDKLIKVVHPMNHRYLLYDIFTRSHKRNQFSPMHSVTSRLLVWKPYLLFVNKMKVHQESWMKPKKLSTNDNCTSKESQIMCTLWIL